MLFYNNNLRDNPCKQKKRINSSMILKYGYEETVLCYICTSKYA